MGARLGQHFLRDRGVLEDILKAAALRPGERVLEVGPGRGVLTEALATAVGPGGHVVAVEVDPALCRGLEGRWANVELWLADAAKADLARRGPYGAVVANLPYQISGPVTVSFLDLLRQARVEGSRGWTRAVLMVQKEFADRLVAAPGSRDFGRLTVQVQRWCKAERVRSVRPGCFDPPPRVDSAVVRLLARDAPPSVADEGLWDVVLRGAFGQRRKKLRNALPPALAGAGLAAEGLAALEALGHADRRAEELSVDDFVALTKAIRGS